MAMRLSARNEASARKLFLVSIVTILAAACLQFAALNQDGKALRIRANSLSKSDELKAQARNLAQSHHQIGNRLMLLGCCCALVCVVSLIASAKRLKPPLRVSIFVLLGFYLILLFVVV